MFQRTTVLARGAAITFAVIAATILIMLAALIANAQESRGSINGHVVDSSGAVVPGAEVSVTNNATAVKRTMAANGDGTYQFLYLLPGTYTLSATAKGFRVTTESVQIQLDETAKEDLTLQVGAATQMVNVTAEPPALQTADANLGQVVNSRQISNLPNLGGSPYIMFFMTPGVAIYNGDQTGSLPQNLDIMSQELSVNGTPMGTTNFTIDGDQAMQVSHGIGPENSPPADLVQEMRVQTSFDASVGHTAGMVVNVALKTGANTPHGSAYNFFQDCSAWNAATWFQDRAHQALVCLPFRHWGGTFEGPVYIPKLYDLNPA